MQEKLLLAFSTYLSSEVLAVKAGEELPELWTARQHAASGVGPGVLPSGQGGAPPLSLEKQKRGREALWTVAWPPLLGPGPALFLPVGPAAF